MRVFGGGKSTSRVCAFACISFFLCVSACATANPDRVDAAATYIAVGNLDQLKTILDSGVSPNAEQNEITLLTRSVISKKPEIVEYLLSVGADPNKQSSAGHNAIYEAVIRGQLKILEMLLRNGGSVTKYEERYEGTAWSYAFSQNESLAFTKLFLLNGLSIDEQSPWSGNTLLHLAVRSENLPIVRVLLEYGPNVEIENNFGRTAIDIALNKKNEALRELLDIEERNATQTN